MFFTSVLVNHLIFFTKQFLPKQIFYLSRSNKRFRVTAQLDFDAYLNGRRPNSGVNLRLWPFRSQ